MSNNKFGKKVYAQKFDAKNVKRCCDACKRQTVTSRHTVSRLSARRARSTNIRAANKAQQIHLTGLPELPESLELCSQQQQ